VRAAAKKPRLARSKPGRVGAGGIRPAVVSAFRTPVGRAAHGAFRAGVLTDRRSNT